MNTELEKLLKNPPYEAKFEDVVEFDKFDNRLPCVDLICVNTIGMNDGFIEWCPNDTPPKNDELLAWIWIIRPDLGKYIKNIAQTELQKLIECYNNNDLDEFFEWMNN